MPKDCLPTQVRNPISKRCIDKTGPTYKKLVKEGVIRPAKPSSPIKAQKPRSPVKVPSRRSPIKAQKPRSPVKVPSSPRLVCPAGCIPDPNFQLKKSPPRRLKKVSRLPLKSPVRSKSKTPVKSKTRSPVRSKSKTRSPVRSKSRTPVKSKTRSPVRSKSRSRSPVRSASPVLSSRTISPPAPLPSWVKGNDYAVKMFPCVTRSKMLPKQHQIRIVDYLFSPDSDARGVAAIYQVGSGKTLIGVMASQCFLDANPTKKVIVVCPKSLIANFQKEMRSYGVQNSEKYEFYTFQGFSKSKDPCSTCRGNMVIIDEVHEIRTKPKEGTNSGRALKCARCAAKVLLLTATPYVNEIGDLQNIVSMVKGKETVLSKRELNKLLDDKPSLGKLLEDVFIYYEPPSKKGYPTPFYHDIEIKMEGKYLHDYEEVEKKNLQALTRLGLRDPTRFYTGLRTSLLAIEENPKIKYTMDKIVEIYDKGGKIVVYSNFVRSGIRQISDILVGMGLPHALIDGTVSAQDRRSIIEDYNRGNIRILLITKAASAGVDLKESTAILIMDVPWNDANMKQIIGRVIRYKSHADPDAVVDVYTLYAVKPYFDGLPSADSYLRSIIQRKKTDSERAIDLLKGLSVDSTMTRAEQQNLLGSYDMMDLR